MKSKVVSNVCPAEEHEQYSDLKVMRSAAGWYIGTTRHHPDGFVDPGSRDSDYFRKKEEAEHYLATINKMPPNQAAQFLRQMP